MNSLVFQLSRRSNPLDWSEVISTFLQILFGSLALQTITLPATQNTKGNGNTSGASYHMSPTEVEWKSDRFT